MKNKSEAIRRYVFAKDNNRPYLLDDAFTENATVQMHVQTESIAFPPSLTGREAITDTLVRQFNQQYENIYTLCIGTEPEIVAQDFSCNWFVVMSEKQTRSLRVGCGRYDWRFGHTDNKIQSLTVTIDLMETATLSSLTPVLEWVSGLPYPWCELSAIAKERPDSASVVAVVNHLVRMA